MYQKYRIRFAAVLLIYILFTITAFLQAQVPRTISFQGQLNNPDGSKLADGPVSLEFLLYESETDGTAIWSETQSVNIKNSLFTAILGKVTSLTAAFDKPYWVGIKVNGNSELTPRIALTSSPYSLGGTATVTEPGPGQNFQIRDSNGKVTHLLNSDGNLWSAGTGTFGNAIVVGDTTVVPDTSFTSMIKTDKLNFGINKTFGILGADFGGRIGKGGIGVFGWAKNNKIAVYAMAQSGVGVIATSQSGPAIQAFSTSGIAVDAQSTTKAGVSGFSVNGDGIVGNSRNGLAGHFKSGNVRIENKLQIDVVPSTTEKSYLVWSSDHFVKVNSTPPGTFDGILIEIPLIIKNSAGNDVIKLPTDGPADFSQGLHTPLPGGRMWFVDPMEGPGIRDASGNPFFEVDPDGNTTIGGDLFVRGSILKGEGQFRIDHPLDPLNKYLNHSFVESPDMMNVYNGNVVLDEEGEATIELPDWFGILNKDFRYQLTPVGSPGPNLYIAQKVKDNTFKISGGVAGMEVSWQITGIRQDPYANLHRIKVEVDKPITERGKFLHPDAYGQSVVENK